MWLGAPLVWAQGYAGGGLAAPGSKGNAARLSVGAGDPAGADKSTGKVTGARADEWKVYGRYQFSETWGAEFDYANWGRTGSAGTGKTPGSAAAAGAPPQGMAPRGSQIDLAATGTLPLARGLSLFGKLGYGRNESGASPYCLSAACGPLGAARREGTRAGLGLRYSFSNNWGLRLDYENVNTLANPDTVPAKGDSWSARIKYTF